MLPQNDEAHMGLTVYLLKIHSGLEPVGDLFKLRGLCPHSHNM